ncbi:MAG: DUF2284 domain-containing protein [Planctomycetota bacterium]|nr:MAG: DUF2284 domain-containing protein [Planctomycetota bacterium]
MAKKKTTKKKTTGRRPLPPIKNFINRAVKLGAKSAKVVKASSVKTAAWVRLKCQYGCDGYGSSLCCPPHTPIPEEMRKVIDCYKNAILFESVYGKTKEIAAKLEREIFLAGYYKAFGLGAGPCRLCDECDFENGCIHSEDARPSMEACGIDVYETARGNGYEIEVVRNRKDKQHYYGVILVN